MTLRPEDVRNILAILDSTAYDTLTVRADNVEVSLRRGVAGWTQQATPLAEPNLLDSTTAEPTTAEPNAAEPPAGAPALTPAREGGAVPARHPTGARPSQPSLASGQGRPPVVAGGAKPSTDPGTGAPDDLVAVTAPVVGTFYRAPRPGASPFVEVGDHVEADTVVGIIETMKLMTSVSAGTAGTVAQICVGNDEFAQQGAPVLLIAPA